MFSANCSVFYTAECLWLIAFCLCHTAPSASELVYHVRTFHGHSPSISGRSPGAERLREDGNVLPRPPERQELRGPSTLELFVELRTICRYTPPALLPRGCCRPWKGVVVGMSNLHSAELRTSASPNSARTRRRQVPAKPFRARLSRGDRPLGRGQLQHVGCCALLLDVLLAADWLLADDVVFVVGCAAVLSCCLSHAAVGFVGHCVLCSSWIQMADSHCEFTLSWQICHADEQLQQYLN